MSTEAGRSLRRTIDRWTDDGMTADQLLDLVAGCDAIEAEVRAALLDERDAAVSARQEAESRLGVARFVAEHWRDDYLRFMKEPPASTQWAIGTHPLNLVLAAMDGETDPPQLGLPETVHPVLRATLARTREPTGEGT